MTVQVSWEDIYAICQNMTSISHQDSFLGSDIGVMLGKLKMLLTDHPSLASGQSIIEQRKTTGSSVVSRGAAGYERVQGVRNPVSTWPWDANAFNLALPLWLLFQTGVTESTKKKEYKKYVDGHCEVWANLLRVPGDLAKSHRLIGAIVSSLTLSAEENGALKSSAEFLGYDLETDFDAASAVLEFAAMAPLLWQDAVVLLGNNEEQVYLPGFSLTMINNAISKFYDEKYPVRHILGDLGGTGTFSLPWDSGANSQDANKQIDDFIAGEDKKLIIYWGHKDSVSLVAGDLAIKLNISYTGADLAAPDEIVTECPFEVVDDGEFDPFEILLHDDTDRSIP